MNPTLPAHTLRTVAAALRQLSYTPTSWKGLLSGHSQPICEQLEPLLVQMDGLVGPSGTGDQDAQLLVIQLVGITE